jgi:hypothetical protein
LSRLEYSARRDDIVGLDQFAQVRRREALGREPILREFQTRGASDRFDVGNAEKYNFVAA